MKNLTKKKLQLSILLYCLFAVTIKASAAPLTGTKNIPGDYATLSLAITDLNTQGVGAGGVIINLLSGNPETAPSGGYVIGGVGSLVLTTTSALNPVIVTGNGNTITAASNQTAGRLSDGIFKLIGADFITVSGFVMMENAANTITADGTNNMTEWGVALLYVTTTNGAQNNVIQNNTITLNRAYQNTYGIYSSSTHSATSPTVNASSLTAAGSNSNLKVYGNTISNVNFGIVNAGPAGATDINILLDIGGTSPAQGNTITNFGTTGTHSPFTSIPSSVVYGIYVQHTVNINISNNTIISSNGGTTVGASLRGINIDGFFFDTSGTFSTVINKNSISLRSGLGTMSIVGITVTQTSTTPSSSVSITNNDFNTTTHTVAASGVIIFINNFAPTRTQDISGNTFTNISCNTSGSLTFISSSAALAASAVMNVNSNSIITGYTKATGATIFFSTSAASVNGSIQNVNNNNISNITCDGFKGIESKDGVSIVSGPVKSINSNKFENIITTQAPVIISIDKCGANSTVNSNIIRNISISGLTGTPFSAILLGSLNQPTLTVSQNKIQLISRNSGITGIENRSLNANISNNTISDFTAPAVITGISSSASTILNIFKNKIGGFLATAVSTSCTGISITSGTQTNIYNNLVGNLKAPNSNSSLALNGLSFTGGTSVNLFNNTVHLNASSTGASFGANIMLVVSAINFTMRNNIFVNLSTPGPTGRNVIYFRSDASLSNYQSESNNNLFFSGTPSANNLMFFDFTNSDQTLAAYKSRVFPRDSNSITENPSFLSLIDSSANFLHINAAVPTSIESGGKNVTSPVTITDDFDNEIRQGNAGYTGTGTAPDIGADEFNSGSSKSLNLTMLIQGFYDAGTNSMIRDTVRIYLRNSSSPFAIVDSAKAYLSSTGAGTFSFQNASNGVNYYLHLKHRNSIETWSKTTQTFTGNSMTYDFTTANTQAFGDNLIQVDASPVRFAIFGGDVDQDGTVDATDMSMIYNDAQSFVSGYVVTDLNGDDFVDGTDFSIADNNAANFVSVERP
ncbi:MAG: hypothetical protein IPL67_00020 [Ignavibacteria bacterium]|nr:hypothetical protein [Ignavibacteria bacterium]